MTDPTGRLDRQDALKQIKVDSNFLRKKYSDVNFPMPPITSAPWTYEDRNVNSVEIGFISFAMFFNTLDHNFCADPDERDTKERYTEEEIFKEIERSLSHIYRYNSGLQKGNVSVRKHSVLVHSLAKYLFPDEPDVHLEALLHDLHEAVTGDVIYQVKKLIPWFDELEDIINRRLKYWLFSNYLEPEDMGLVRQKVNLCDQIAYGVETAFLSSEPKKIPASKWEAWYKAALELRQTEVSDHLLAKNALHFETDMVNFGKESLLSDGSMFKILLRETGLFDSDKPNY